MPAAKRKCTVATVVVRVQVRRLAVALILAKGFAAPELAKVYARAGELCHEVDDPELWFRSCAARGTSP